MSPNSRGRAVRDSAFAAAPPYQSGLLTCENAGSYHYHHSRKKIESMRMSRILALVILGFIVSLGCACDSIENTQLTNHNGDKERMPRVDSLLGFNSMITAIFIDSKERMWVGSHCDGLCVSDASMLNKSAYQRVFNLSLIHI